MIPWTEAAWLAALAAVIGAVATPIRAAIVAWINRRKTRRETDATTEDWRTLVDAQARRLEQLEARVKALEDEAVERAQTISRQSAYISTLRGHISERKPPPPPPPPDPTETI